MVETTEAELRGRIMTLETVLMTLMAHMAAHTSNPTLFTAQVMDNANSALQSAAENAPAEMEETAVFALESFGALTQQMLAHLHRHAVPQGQG